MKASTLIFIMIRMKNKRLEVQLEYLEVTVQEKLRIGWPGPFVKVEGYCD
jgi:hypothetical protein